MHTITLLVGAIGAGEHTLTKAGDVGDAHPGGTLNVDERVAGPAVIQRNLGEHEAARRLTEITLQRLLGQQTAQHLIGRPTHRGHRGDAHALEEFGAVGIVHASHHVLHLEQLASHTRGNDVRVITRRDGRKGVGLGNSGALEGLLIETHTGHQLTLKTLAQRLEGALILIDDGNRVPGSLQRAGQHDAHAPGAHDDKVRHASLHVLMTRFNAYPSSVIEPLIELSFGAREDSLNG